MWNSCNARQVNSSEGPYGHLYTSGLQKARPSKYIAHHTFVVSDQALDAVVPLLFPQAVRSVSGSVLWKQQESTVTLPDGNGNQLFTIQSLILQSEESVNECGRRKRVREERRSKSSRKRGSAGNSECLMHVHDDA